MKTVKETAHLGTELLFVAGFVLAMWLLLQGIFAL